MTCARLVRSWKGDLRIEVKLRQKVPTEKTLGTSQRLNMVIIKFSDMPLNCKVVPHKNVNSVLQNLRISRSKVVLAHKNWARYTLKGGKSNRSSSCSEIDNERRKPSIGPIQLRGTGFATESFDFLNRSRGQLERKDC